MNVKINPKLDEHGRIANDLPCLGCGYNLRTLSPERACPECGLPVRRTLGDDLLRYSDLAWVRRLTSGVNWLLASILLVFPIGQFVRSYLIGWDEPPAGDPMAWAHGLWHLLTHTVLLVGVWRVTTAEPVAAHVGQDLKGRWQLRLAALGLIALDIAGLAPGLIAERERLTYGRLLLWVILVLSALAFASKFKRRAEVRPIRYESLIYHGLLGGFLFAVLCIVVSITIAITGFGMPGVGWLFSLVTTLLPILLVLVVIVVSIDLYRLRRAMLRAAAQNTTCTCARSDT